jgi:4-hydroxy-2-oxoheptanedioate aldolase
MIETRTAVENLEAIAEVPGIDALYVGPSDLGISMGLGPGGDHDDQGFIDAMEHFVAVCRANGIAPGIHATPTLAPKRVEQGFLMITATSDHLAAIAGAKAAVATARATAGAAASDALY